MPEIIDHATQVERLVADFDRKLRLARATDLAKAGRFLEAESLLHSSRGIPEGGKELDLLARIAVRRRHFGKARLLWEAAMRSEPQNGEYRQCVEQLREREVKLKRWIKVGGIGFLSLIGAAVLAIGIASVTHRHQVRAVPAAQHDGGVKAQKSP
jgi:hypothetical protein